MARHRCNICGAEFDTLSEYRRHMQTSHPERAPSAADLESAIGGIGFPALPARLAEHARARGSRAVAEILDDLPRREYRDAAEVARAFGEMRSHQGKPRHQPSERGGTAAMEALSAARIASLFEGVSFPASRDDLADHVRDRARDEEVKVIERLPDRRYSDMADVERGFGEVAGEGR